MELRFERMSPAIRMVNSAKWGWSPSSRPPSTSRSSSRPPSTSRSCSIGSHTHYHLAPANKKFVSIFCCFYLCNTGLETEFSKSVLIFWVAPLKQVVNMSCYLRNTGLETEFSKSALKFWIGSTGLETGWKPVLLIMVSMAIMIKIFISNFGESG